MLHMPLIRHQFRIILWHSLMPSWSLWSSGTWQKPSRLCGAVWYRCMTSCSTLALCLSARLVISL